MRGSHNSRELIAGGAGQARRARRSLRSSLLWLHRWLSVGAALFWIIQALTGLLIAFHWELEDRSVSRLQRPTNWAAIERRMLALAPTGADRSVTSIWTTAGLPDRYDITVSGASGAKTAVRVAGDGTILRTRDRSERGIWGTLVSIHQTLLAGDIGSWIVGVSGILLLTNLLSGLVLAWPKRMWRRAVVPVRSGPPAARLYSWHRAVGLWAVVPAIALVSAGVMLTFKDGVAAAIGVEPVEVSPAPADGRPFIPFSVAVRTAQSVIPGSRFTAAMLPTPENATYRFRMLAPCEVRRAYGTTVVFVDAVTGRTRGVFPACEAPWPRAFIDGLYAFHTGEMGGLFGRLMLLATGTWLLTMTTVGLLLWQRRRAGSQR